jgi:pimeloyl-ACP methyl ester carboxylesterase
VAAPGAFKNVDFVGRWRIWYAVSGIFLLLCLGAIALDLFAERHPERVARLALDAFVWTGKGSPTLAERKKKLAAEGLLGHQHANSGWGTFDDDNMVGATAFMETLELAVELRRAGYGDNGERLGFDLYPYTEDAIEAVRRSLLQWRFIDEVAGRIDDAALREAQAEKDAVRAYELVYAALGA